MLKYPFSVNSKFTIFPLLGTTYRAIFLLKLNDEETEGASDLNAFWLKFGLGFDCFFTNNVFLRTGIVYGIRHKNKFESDMIDILISLGEGLVRADKLLGHGLEIKLAVGYAF